MSIRYCTATSKCTHQPCRARAMWGMQVCYHHGGKSLRGFVHPNYKHGYYVKHRDLVLLWLFRMYQDHVRAEQSRRVVGELYETMSTETAAQFQRFLKAYRASMAHVRPVKLAAPLAAQLMAA